MQKNILLLTTAALFASPAIAGGLFFHARCAHSRHRISAYDYRTSRPRATTAVLSMPPVPVVAVSSQSNTVSDVSRQFILPDAVAGSVRLSNLAAKTYPAAGLLVLSGTLNHTGGPAGQQRGSKAVIRVEALTGSGTSAASQPVIARREVACWVRTNEPESVKIPIQCHQISRTDISNITRIRLVLEHHPNR